MSAIKRKKPDIDRLGQVPPDVKKSKPPDESEVDQAWAESVWNAVKTWEREHPSATKPKRFSTVIKKAMKDVSMTAQQHRVQKFMGRQGGHYEKKWQRESTLSSKVTPGRLFTSAFKKGAGAAIDAVHQKTQKSIGAIKGTGPGTYAFPKVTTEDAHSSIHIEEIDEAGNPVVSPDAENGDVAHNINPRNTALSDRTQQQGGTVDETKKSSTPTTSTALTVLGNVAKGAAAGAMIGGGEGGLAGVVAGAAAGALSSAKQEAGTIASDALVEFSKSAKQQIGSLANHLGNRVDNFLTPTSITLADRVAIKLAPKGAQQPADAPARPQDQSDPSASKNTALIPFEDPLEKANNQRAIQHTTVDDYGNSIAPFNFNFKKPAQFGNFGQSGIGVLLNHQQQIQGGGIDNDVSALPNPEDFIDIDDDEFDDLDDKIPDEGDDDGDDDGDKPTPTPTPDPQKEKPDPDPEKEKLDPDPEDEEEEGSSEDSGGGSTTEKQQKTKGRYVPNFDFQNPQQMKLNQYSAARQETQVRQDEKGGDVLGPGSERIDHSLATLRPRFGLAGPENVIPASRDQLASDLRFDLFSVVQPGYGEGRDNKIFQEQKFRENHVLPVGGYYKPNSWLGPLNTQHPLPWQFQSVKSMSKVAQYDALMASRRQKGFKATLAVGEGSTQVMGRDYPEIKSGVSSSGLQRDARSFFEPSILTQDRMRPVIDPAGVSLNKRGFRRAFETWREPMMGETPWDEGGPTLKKRRALEVVLP